MIGEEAWLAYERAHWEVMGHVIRASDYGGIGLHVARVKTPGRDAMAEARFGLSVFQGEEPIYPRDPVVEEIRAEIEIVRTYRLDEPHL